MSQNIEIIGVYPIEDQEYVHLVELIIKDNTTSVNIVGFTQEIPGLPKSDWQAPFSEKILTEDGTVLIADSDKEAIDNKLWSGNIRFVFFLFLDSNIPLSTPFGKLQLPKSSALPERLQNIIVFESPE